MYKYLFGPVPSRRLGMSLGIDMVPKKVCSLDCVYCEVGKTTKLTTQLNEYILYDKVIAELMDYFANNPDPDYFTFSGSGEPTLNIRIGDVLDFLKETKPNIPVAVLTNGTMFSDVDVRKALRKADLVLPSLDAVTEETFQKINRPAEGLTAKKCLDGLIEFSKEYTGKIWLEIFILPGYNDNDTDILALKNAINQIKPDLVQLNTLDRPGTIAGLRSANADDMQRIIELLDYPEAKVIAASAQRKNMQSYRTDTESAILGTIARRPCTLEDMVKILGLHVNEINKYLDVLEADKKIKTIRQERGVFYQIAE
ncbi:MAG: radical SAM protein [Bacteroidales bacterium]|nr:radical SAM protein [Bacteroidales bacterium]MDD4217216.1 radical SAM protein [Bacteroidales bacterium]MDY0141332.1 radical SAM protein [Bacteroidales bacterium]